MVEPHLAANGVDARPSCSLDGAVENAIRLGVADVIADVVDTGATLRQAGLEPVGKPILESSALLIAPARDPGRRRRSCSWSAGCRASWSPAGT